MPVVNVFFPVLGTTLPTDHGYELYAALSRLVPALHEGGRPLLVGPVLGAYAGRGLLQLDRGRSRLRFRLPAEDIPLLLPLAGKSLDVAGHALRLGVPQVQALVPAPSLTARLVTFKHSTDPARFLAVARQKLAALGVTGEPAIPLVRDGPRRGEPRRRVLRIKTRRVIGYAMHVTALTAADSLTLQEHGLGGRRRMGCGFFVPTRTQVET
jgi:CRISPR-associated protein Cas6